MDAGFSEGVRQNFTADGEWCPMQGYSGSSFEGVLERTSLKGVGVGFGDSFCRTV